jgi:hypothetical protein
MGHADPSMILKHYKHTSETKRRSAVQSFPDIPPHVPAACAQEKKELSD